MWIMRERIGGWGGSWLRVDVRDLPRRAEAFAAWIESLPRKARRMA